LNQLSIQYHNSSRNPRSSQITRRLEDVLNKVQTIVIASLLSLPSPQKAFMAKKELVPFLCPFIMVAERNQKGSPFHYTIS